MELNLFFLISPSYCGTIRLLTGARRGRKNPTKYFVNQSLRNNIQIRLIKQWLITPILFSTTWHQLSSCFVPVAVHTVTIFVTWRPWPPFILIQLLIFCSDFCIINPILTKPKKPKALHDYTQYCNLIARLHAVQQWNKTPWYSLIARLHAVQQSKETPWYSPVAWLHTVPQSTKTPWYSPIAWLHAVLQSDCTNARSLAIQLLDPSTLR